MTTIAEKPLTTRQERMAVANQVLMALAKSERNFFRNKTTGEVSQFTRKGNGAIHFLDNYSKMQVRIVKGKEWPGFTNGGTMRDLVEMLYGYIVDGVLLNRWYIAPTNDNNYNYWGYTPEGAAKCREECFKQPCFEPA